VRAFRTVLDALGRGEPTPRIDLSGVVEGQKETFGAYRKGWR
jgi:putative protease